MWAVVQRERDAQEALAKRKRDACESVKGSVIQIYAYRVKCTMWAEDGGEVEVRSKNGA